MDNFNIAFVVWKSENFSMTGETHGVSVLAGVVQRHFSLSDENILILDAYGIPEQDSSSYILSCLCVFQPDIVAFSCPYGSYTDLRNYYQECKRQLNNVRIIIFGGALPTYAPDKFLDIDEEAYVIRGEGEEAIVQLIEYSCKDLAVSTLEQIPNICYRKKGKTIVNERKMVDLRKVAVPFRKHIGNTLMKNAQIYVEHSRGCTWSNCSFCSRNLLSIANCKPKYRMFSKYRLLEDLIKLREMNIQSVTFSDEDFCGSGLNEMRELLDVFQEINSEKLLMNFDVSMNVNSIYSSLWSTSEYFQRIHFLDEMHKNGLRKVFLGVESGAEEQIKRYRKQQDKGEALKAIRILEKLGFEIEIGYIVFDPLCTMDEVRENLYFLKENNITKYVSSLGSGLELRLHMDSPYMKLLERYDKEYGIRLYSKTYNIDTLNYESIYLNDDVSQMAFQVKSLNEKIRPIYYPLKSVSRYGTRGSLKDDIEFVRQIVVSIREQYVDCLIEVAAAISKGERYDIYISRMESFMNNLIAVKGKWLSRIAETYHNPVLKEMLKKKDVTGEIC